MPTPSFSDPTYPVVKPSPSVDDCLKSFRFGDYAKVVGVTGGSWGYGYVLGKPARFAAANCAASIGFTFATLLILQDSRNRFMGYRENGAEVKQYGVHSEQKLSIHKPIKWKNYN